jgi:hypothetical protein
MRVKSFLLVASIVALGGSTALAQSVAPSGGAPRAVRPAIDAAYPLGAAYRDIGRAEQAGATGHYIDAARTHYRAGLDRYGRNDDAGAAAEARVASDLARAALDERPAVERSGPKDVPAPPSPRPVTGGPDGAVHVVPMPGMHDGNGPDGAMLRVESGLLRVRNGMPPMISMGGDGPFMGIRHGGYNATRLAEILKVETGAEARQLAQSAVDANAAAQRAALAGNVREAARMTRISDDLAAAVHDIAAVNHPEFRNAPQMIRIERTSTM